MVYIVQRLEEQAAFWPQGLAKEAVDYIRKLEAANLKQSCIKLDDQMRIEKLEAALRDLLDGWECCAVSKAMRRVARDAMEGKDD